jgi:hypothetical protein
MLQVYVSSVSGVLDVCFKCFIWMLHMLLCLYTYVSSICFECFRLMLQVFRLNFAKVDLNVLYVAMAIDVCFKCFICFRRMLQVFHLDVSKVDIGGAHIAIAWWWCYCCYVGHRSFQKYVVAWVTVAPWVTTHAWCCVHACRRVTTLSASAATVCVHAGVGHHCMF